MIIYTKVAVSSSHLYPINNESFLLRIRRSYCTGSSASLKPTTLPSYDMSMELAPLKWNSEIHRIFDTVEEEPPSLPVSCDVVLGNEATVVVQNLTL